MKKEKKKPRDDRKGFILYLTDIEKAALAKAADEDGFEHLSHWIRHVALRAANPG